MNKSKEVKWILYAIKYLMEEKIIYEQKDVAKYMNMNESSVSRILNQKQPLSDKFIDNFNLAFNNVFNPTYLRTGEGDMLKPITQNNKNGNNISGNNVTISVNTEEKLFEIIRNRDAEIKSKDIQIQKLLDIISKMQE